MKSTGLDLASLLYLIHHFNRESEITSNNCYERIYPKVLNSRIITNKSRH